MFVHSFMVAEQVTSIICNSILFGTCKIFVWLEGEMYCMLSVSLCLSCTAVKHDNKSERNAVLRDGKVLAPGALCTGGSVQRYAGHVKIWAFRKGIFPYAQKTKSLLV